MASRIPTSRFSLADRGSPGAGRVLRACALTIALLVSLAAFTTTAHAATKRKQHKPLPVTTKTPITRGSRYLALGDSVTFGYEESGVVPTPNYDDQSSFLGYPEMIGSALHLKVVNAACSGETSSSLIDVNAPSNGCENSPGNPHTGYRTSFPLHVSYTGSQLEYAVSYLTAHKDVRLVSLMIGANDFYVCQETTPDGCASPTEQAGVAARVTANIKHILSAIRKQAHYRGQLAIVNYYSLNYASPATNAQSQLLNKVQDSAAKPFHVVVANGFGEWQAATAQFGGGSCAARLLTQLGTPGKCGIHPSYAGQALLAQALEKVIRL
jgi:lysophospholipase L1-like esterase